MNIKAKVGAGQYRVKVRQGKSRSEQAIIKAKPGKGMIGEVRVKVKMVK